MIDQNQLCHGKKNISTDQFNRNSKVNVVDRLKPAFMVSSSLANVLKEKNIQGNPTNRATHYPKSG